MADTMVRSVSQLPSAPDFMPDSNAGREKVGLKEMVLPRLGLCQDNSRARKKDRPEFIPKLEEGQFFNSLTKEIYGTKIQIVPLFFYQSRIMFKDMKEGGGIICQAPDGVSCQMNAGGPCLHSAWGPKGEPPECSEFFNYASLIYRGPGALTEELIIVSLKTTGLAAAKVLNSLMRMRKKASYAGVYELSSVSDSNKAGQSYYTWMATNYEANPWTDKELYDEAEKMYKIVSEGLASGKIKADMDIDDEAFARRDEEV